LLFLINTPVNLPLSISRFSLLFWAFVFSHAYKAFIINTSIFSFGEGAYNISSLRYLFIIK